MLPFFYLYTLFAFVQANNSIYKITDNNYNIINNNYKITNNNYNINNSIYNENTCKFRYNNTSITGHNCSITNGTFLRYCYDYTKCISNQSICNEKIFEDETEIVETRIGDGSTSELGPLKYLSGLTGLPMDRIINYLLLTIIFVSYSSWMNNLGTCSL